MNPLPLVLAELRRNPLGCLAIVALLAVATAVGLAIDAGERALRLASARASDRFDLIVGAAGSPTQLMLTTVFLQPAPLELVPPAVLLELAADPGVAMLAPVAVTDSYRGYVLVGTTAGLATDGGSIQVAQGRVFARPGEALVGSAVDLPLGATIRPAHGAPAENLLETHDHDREFAIVGRIARTGTPWDRVILVPIEAVWAMHGAKESPGEAVRPDGSTARLGPPWTAATAHGVPALVVKPRTVADAYRLRQRYRGGATTALFPAEALNQLYLLLGNVRALVRALAVAFDILLVAAVLLVIVAVLSARRQSVGVLRALGAPPAFVLAAVWLQGAVLIATGVAAGVLLAAVLTPLAAAAGSERLGLALDARIGMPELAFAATLLVAGSLLAALPSLGALRVPVIRLLRSG